MLLGSYFGGMMIAAPLFGFNPEGSSFRREPESVKLS
jgi:hypothetical protein